MSKSLFNSVVAVFSFICFASYSSAQAPEISQPHGPDETVLDCTSDYGGFYVWQIIECGEHGFVDAQRILGNTYYKGQIDDVDFVEAARWYRMAAEQGDIEAQYSLGYMYAEGQGVEVDIIEAIKWYIIAARPGSTRSEQVISGLQLRLDNPDQHIEAERRASEWIAAHQQQN